MRRFNRFIPLLVIQIFFFAFSQNLLGQSKFAIKANKAFAKNKWEKFLILREKQHLKDSHSIDYAFIQWLQFSTKTPLHHPGKYYQSALKFDSLFQKLSLKNQKKYTEKLKIQYSPNLWKDSALKIFLNQLIQTNDTAQIHDFVIKFHDSASIPVVQNFITHYLQKYIAVGANRTIQILETKYAWHEAIAQKELNAILMFRDKFPNSFCDDLALKLEAHYAFLQASKVNTIEEFTYIKIKYANTIFARLADSVIAERQFSNLKNKFDLKALIAFNQQYKNSRLNNLIASRIIGLDKMDSTIVVVNKQLNLNDPKIPRNVTINLESVQIQGKKKLEFSVSRKNGRKMVYSYVQHLPFYESHVLKASDFERDEFIMVNENSGKIIDLAGKPLFCLRIDSTVELVTENQIKSGSVGVQIVKQVHQQIVPAFSQIFDTLDFSQKTDKIYSEQGKIFCKITDFISKSSLTVPIGTYVFQHGDSGWYKTDFIPEMGDYQKPITKDFCLNWIAERMPLFCAGTFASFSKMNEFRTLQSITEKPEGCLFPIAFDIVNGEEKLVCVVKPLKGADYTKIEKYKTLGLDKDFIYIELEKAISMGEIAAFPVSFNSSQLFSAAYSLGLFQTQYPSTLVDENFCYLMNKSLLVFDPEFTKPILKKWAVNFVQYRMSTEYLLDEIITVPLFFDFKVKLDEYNSNNQSFTLRADKNTNPMLTFINANMENLLSNSIQSFHALSPINDLVIDHVPTMVFNKGSETDFTIHVKESDAGKLQKLADSDKTIYVRMKITPVLKPVGKECKVCATGSCDEYKLRNCKIIYQAEQYEFSSNSEFKQTLILKQ